MAGFLGHLDRVLRGDATRFSDLSSGKLDIPLGRLTVVIVALAVLYGACIGVYALTLGRETQVAMQQLLASAVKLPLLFFLTLLVTLPSLYVYNALIGSRLSFDSVMRLLVASIGVIVAVAASQGPIVVFFTVSTESYPFMVVLNVISLGVAGLLGLIFLGRTLNRLVLIGQTRDLAPAEDADASDEADTDSSKGKSTLRGPLDRGGLATSRPSVVVFRVWLVVFALVGAQMSWVLRPFIGNPNLEFEWFRARESNFFEAVFRAIGKLFS